MYIQLSPIAHNPFTKLAFLHSPCPSTRYLTRTDSSLGTGSYLSFDWQSVHLTPCSKISRETLKHPPPPQLQSSVEFAASGGSHYSCIPALYQWPNQDCDHCRIINSFHEPDSKICGLTVKRNEAERRGRQSSNLSRGSLTTSNYQRTIRPLDSETVVVRKLSGTQIDSASLGIKEVVAEAFFSGGAYAICDTSADLNQPAASSKQSSEQPPSTHPSPPCTHHLKL